MEDQNINVPYIVYEGAQARQERTIRRLITVIIILISMLFATNAIWLYSWNSYEYIEEDSSLNLNAEDGGNANYIGRDLNGDFSYGEDINKD